MGRHEVANEDQDCHDHVLGYRDDIAASDLSDGDSTVSIIRSVQIHVIGADTSGHRELEILCLSQTLRTQISRMEPMHLVQQRSKGSGIVVYVWVLTTGHEVWEFNQTYGVVIITSASTSSFSKIEFSPSLSEVVTRVWPWLSSHFLRPSSFSVVPRSPSCCCAWMPPCRSEILSVKCELTPNWETRSFDRASSPCGLQDLQRKTYIIEDHQNFPLRVSSVSMQGPKVIEEVQDSAESPGGKVESDRCM